MKQLLVSPSFRCNFFYVYLEFLIFFNFLGRFYTVDSESEVRIHFNDRFDYQFNHFTVSHEIIYNFFILQYMLL